MGTEFSGFFASKKATKLRPQMVLTPVPNLPFQKVYSLSSILLNRLKKVIVVIIAASISLIGSAKKTANTLFWIKSGRIKIKGINKISFLKQASNRLTFACPRAIKLCWQQT